MKRFIYASLAAIAVAAPAAAQTQLEQTVGAAPGEYSSATLAELFFAKSAPLSEQNVVVDRDEDAMIISSKAKASGAAEAFRFFAQSDDDLSVERRAQGGFELTVAEKTSDNAEARAVAAHFANGLSGSEQ